MRAREPDVTGTATSGDGVRIAYETFGTGDPTLVLLPVGADHPFAPVEGPGPLPQPPSPRDRL